MPEAEDTIVMSAWELVRVVAILGPILAMLLVGAILAVRSGVVREAPSQGGRRTLANLSRTLLLVAGSLAGLAVIHQLVGLRLPAIW